MRKKKQLAARRVRTGRDKGEGEPYRIKEVIDGRKRDRRIREEKGMYVRKREHSGEAGSLQGGSLRRGKKKKGAVGGKEREGEEKGG